MSAIKSITRSRLPVPEHASLPVGSVDVLPAVAAVTWPDRPALVTDTETVTFASMDRRISRLASGLRELLGGEGSVVAVAAVPGVEYAVAYYATARSGNVIAPINPRLGAVVLEQLLVSLDARAAVLTRAMFDRARSALARVPSLEHVLLLDGPAARPGPMTCAELSGRGDLLVEPRDRDENELAVIMLGPDGAGYPRGARRSHHSLKVEAMRIATAHGLTPDAVALTAMPNHEQAQLNAAVWAGAAQVFCASPDSVAVALAVKRHGASHTCTPGVGLTFAPVRKAVA